MKSSQETIEFKKSSELHYWLYLPDDYEKSTQSYPLILFLHGKGERGSDLRLVEKHGIPKNLANGNNLPFIVLAPQCPLNSNWEYHLDALEALVTSVEDSYRVDKTRVYLTGLSMGGAGTWSLATAFPHRFAAIIPICGRARNELDYPERLQHIVHLPIWCFHGTADSVVPVTASEELIEAVNGYGAKAKLTLYPGVDHDSWTQTYNNPAIYEWLLSHTIAVEK